MSRTMIALALLGLAAGSVSAQQPRRQQAPNRPQAVRPGAAALLRAHLMGPMATPLPGAAAILRLRRAFNLTDAQVRQLDTIRVQTQRAVQPHVRSAVAAWRAADSALAGSSPDVDRYQASLREAADNLVQAQVIRARAAVQAQGVLTAQQRADLQFARRFRAGAARRGMAGRPGLMGRPGMAGRMGFGMRGRAMMGRGWGGAMMGRPGMWNRMPPGRRGPATRGRMGPPGRGGAAPAAPADTANAS